MSTFTYPLNGSRAAAQISQSLNRITASSPARLVVSEEDTCELDPTLVNILLEVVESFSKGKSVTVVAHESSITTQEAADFVGVSRPTLIKLLEEFKVPYATVGRHRKLAFQDVQQLSTLLREKRLSTLQSIREKSQAIGEYEETLNNPLIK